MSGLRLRVVIVWAGQGQHRREECCRKCLDVRNAPARCNSLGRRCARCVALVQIYNSALLIRNLNRTSPASITP